MPRRVVRRYDPFAVTKTEAPCAPNESEGKGIQITCLVNNTQPLYLEMLPEDEEVYVETEAVSDIQHKKLLNGQMEIECIFLTPNECTKTRCGRLVIDDRHVLELGPLQRDQPVHCATLVEGKPKTFRLEVSLCDDPAVHPSEMLLVRHTLALLENDEFLGSVSSSHLQNQLRDLPFYSDVIGPIKKNWTEFIRAHTDKWDVFKYSPEEIEAEDIGTTCRTKEYRVVARTLLDDYRAGDIARERVRVSAERQLHELLLNKLRQRPYEQRELLADLVKEKAFLAIITPNLTKLLDYFEAYPDRFFVLRDHLHPILVQAKRQGVMDDPKFDLWDNTPKPQYTFECPDYEG